MAKARKVIDVSTNEIYSSISAASRELNISYDDVVKCINESVLVGGRELKFLDEYEATKAAETSSSPDTVESEVLDELVNTPEAADVVDTEVADTGSPEPEDASGSGSSEDSGAAAPVHVSSGNLVYSIDYTLQKRSSISSHDMQEWVSRFVARGIDCKKQSDYILFFGITTAEKAIKLDNIISEYGYEGSFRYTSIDKERYLEVIS